MKFTINFRSTAEFNNHTGSYDLSYGLVFIPVPVWIQGKRKILNLNPDSPGYKKGSVSRLLNVENIEEILKDPKIATITVYSEGIGEQQDLDTLIEDLEKEGFIVNVMR